MSNLTTLQPDTGSGDDDDITDTEWIVIVLVLVIVLVVLIITIAKCLEIGRDSSDKSLLKDDQSVRSGRSTVRSVASSKSRAKSLKKMPLNAEITRFSAGRASRSAEYGVVIKDIGKIVQTDTLSGQASSNQVPPHYQHSNTLQSEPMHLQQAQEPRYVQQGMMMSQAPNASVNVNRQLRTGGGSMMSDSRAVFIAPEDPYYTPTQVQTIPNQATMPMRIVDMGQTYQVVGQGLQSQPVLIMQ